MYEESMLGLAVAADALSQLIASHTENLADKLEVKLPKLSQLAGDRELSVYRGGACSYTLGARRQIMTKDELAAALRAGKLKESEITVYLAEKNVAQIDEDDVKDALDGIEERFEQYAGWGRDMMIDIGHLKETQVFMLKLNEAARTHTTYEDGLRVVVDQEGIKP